ncbi:ThuA domain-containing protein [Gimesia panareensis]|uniref:Trehalose utilization n=1 Tax=Gimesia panareensis TaxID=2527978 RepID=A0A517QFB9_9PLAN|nr:ThuA domain-containing protein [Gimesia panareensis]QDT30336.1 Trehalose utilization [Gimesia panareensis]QDU53403.1 Trehalose utilization [Gimesia panareensis]
MKCSPILSKCCLLLLSAFCFISCTAADQPEQAQVKTENPESQDQGDKLSVLLIDGQNNHNWRETTPILKKILENSGKFTVEVSTTPPGVPRTPRKPANKKLTPEQEKQFEEYVEAWKAEVARLKKENPALWKQWRPDFKKYDVIVSNYNGENWPKAVQQAFDEYVSNGGGFVSVHAADNAFPDWPAYNQMIAVGGWGGRDENSGPMLRLRDGKWEQDVTAGRGGTHGTRIPVVVKVREAEHPIVKGLPLEWMHPADEVYGKLRGPAENVQVLATAYSEPNERGTGEHEPIMMTIDYGKGRVFHTTLGHDTTALQGTGFQITLQRGTEWAATGDVTQTVPEVAWKDNEPTVQAP